MNILIIGGGGREHCLAWKISRSPGVKKIYAAPGNAGIAEIAECADIRADEIEKLADFCLEKKIDLAAAGPEAPLALGVADLFTRKGIKIFGPSKEAARIESSKVFCKDFLKKHGIPSAASETFDEAWKAFDYLKTADYPLVVKADGLCAGKGVTVCGSENEADEAVRLIMEDKVFAAAGERVLIEEYLRGEEVSFMVLTDGKNIAPLMPSRDHKAALDGDRGPNTGGMGAYAPTLILNTHPRQVVLEKIIEPVIRKMAEEGAPYRGVLYAGLMLTETGPKVLEFNARFGDPETQAVLPLLKTDIVELMQKCAEGGLDSRSLEWSSDTAVCVVMASGGYPGKYETGKKITGIDKALARGAEVFHAGTRKENGDILTDGGRVLGVTAAGESAQSAVDRAYQAVREINFEGAYYREDIGWKALKHDGAK